jgi:hypothetical protein
MGTLKVTDPKYIYSTHPKDKKKKIKMPVG